MADQEPVVTVELNTALDREVAQFSTELRDRMKRHLEPLGPQIVTAMQTELRNGVSMSGGRSHRQSEPHHSREEAAAGISGKINDRGDGVALSILSDSSHMSHGRQAFPFAYDKPSWMHPVFGRGSGSVRQFGHPYRKATLEKFEPRVQSELEKAGVEAFDTIQARGR